MCYKKLDPQIQFAEETSFGSVQIYGDVEWKILDHDPDLLALFPKVGDSKTIVFTDPEDGDLMEYKKVKWCYNCKSGDVGLEGFEGCKKKEKVRVSEEEFGYDFPQSDGHCKLHEKDSSWRE